MSNAREQHYLLGNRSQAGESQDRICLLERLLMPPFEGWNGAKRDGELNARQNNWLSEAISEK